MEYLTIKILHNDMTVNVPADNAERVGLRKVIDEEAVKKVVKYLTSGGTEMPKNWNRRFKHNRDKMKTGDIFELAEVVRNLSLRDGEKGLSTGEKQMYVKAKKILASELMYAKNLSEDDAFVWLEGVLYRTGNTRRRSGRRRRSRPAAKPTAEDSSRRLARHTDGVWAVLVAAGRGERLGEDRPKAFARLGELPLLAEPLRRLDECDWIDGIVVVAPPDWEEPAILLAEELGASKVTACVTGRRDPLGSVRIGLAEVPETRRVVLVHDAARPFLPPEIVPRLLDALGEGFDGAVPGLPVADTVKRAPGRRRPRDARRATSSSPSRRRRRSLRRSCAGRRGRGLRLRVARRGGRRPRGGRPRRRAAAQGDDAGRPAARRGLAHRGAGRLASGGGRATDRDGVSTRTRSRRASRSCSAGSSSTIRAASPGHSDGDVLAHALIDAVLGAAGLGDIGSLFPSGEERFRGISSLDAARRRPTRRSGRPGWRLVNADCVLVGEEPRIAAHREEMRRRLQDTIGEGEVNVRATTTDRLGFAGRGEGLAAQAVALLERR